MFSFRYLSCSMRQPRHRSILYILSSSQKKSFFDLYFCQRSKQKSPQQKNTFCQGRINFYPRYHLACCHTYSRSQNANTFLPLTQANVIRYSSHFSNALKGPFVRSASCPTSSNCRTLCECASVFTSLSTVYLSLTQQNTVVKEFLEKRIFHRHGIPHSLDKAPFWVYTLKH